MLIEIFQFVDFCRCSASARMGVSVRAWFDALKRDFHTESVLDRYVLFIWNTSVDKQQIFVVLLLFVAKHFISKMRGYHQEHKIRVM